MSNLVTMLPLARALYRWGVANLSEKGITSTTLANGAVRAKKVGLRASTLALGLALMAPAIANAWNEDESYRTGSGWQSVVDGRLVDVSLKVDGETAPLYFSPRFADQRRYLEAYAGRNYSVALRNNSNRRIGVLIAVDGLNVVNGERTRLAANEAMYVLDPYERTEIRGWRTSLDQVRRFVFVDEKRSYAERTGQANSDMGWIRVLAFREKRTWVDDVRRYKGEERPYSEYHGRDEKEMPYTMDERKSADEPRAQAEEAPASPKSGAAPQPTLRGDAERNGSGYTQDNGGSFPGTGWGDRRHDPVQRVEFRAERTPMDRIIVRYEYASGLRALGIEPDRDDWRHRDRLRDRDGNVGFAKPPRW